MWQPTPLPYLVLIILFSYTRMHAHTQTHTQIRRTSNANTPRAMSTKSAAIHPGFERKVSLSLSLSLPTNGRHKVSILAEVPFSTFSLSLCLRVCCYTWAPEHCARATVHGIRPKNKSFYSLSLTSMVRFMFGCHVVIMLHIVPVLWVYIACMAMAFSQFSCTFDAVPWTFLNVFRVFHTHFHPIDAAFDIP